MCGVVLRFGYDCTEAPDPKSPVARRRKKEILLTFVLVKVLLIHSFIFCLSKMSLFCLLLIIYIFLGQDFQYGSFLFSVLLRHCSFSSCLHYFQQVI